MPLPLFPDLIGKTWALVNLDTCARRDFPDGDNPLLDPVACDRWVTGLARELKADFTYGGYLEDRTHLWRGHYLPPGPQAHLGVDYNVPAGTRVAATASGHVVHIGREGIFGGWGGVVILKLDNPAAAGAEYLYHGHLQWDDTVRVGQQLAAGDIIGIIGEPHENGQWFPHLHLQLVSEGRLQAANGNPLLVDGYMPPPVPTQDFPDPHKLVAL